MENPVLFDLYPKFLRRSVTVLSTDVFSDLLDPLKLGLSMKLNPLKIPY